MTLLNEHVWWSVSHIFIYMTASSIEYSLACGLKQVHCLLSNDEIVGGNLSRMQRIKRAFEWSINKNTRQRYLFLPDNLFPPFNKWSIAGHETVKIDRRSSTTGDAILGGQWMEVLYSYSKTQSFDNWSVPKSFQAVDIKKVLHWHVQFEVGQLPWMFLNAPDESEVLCVHA